MADTNSTLKPRPRPSTPASQNATPQSTSGALFLSSPADARSPATSHPLSAGAIAMQRTDSSHRGKSSSLAATAMQRSGSGVAEYGAAGKTSAKTVPGMSSAGKGLTDVGSRPTTPALLSGLGFAFGSPAGAQGSPAISGTGGSMGLNALAFDSPALGGGGGGAGGVEMGLSLSNMSHLGIGAGLSMTGSMSGRIDDGERRRRLEVILDVLGRRPGRISREAVDRLGRRCEFDRYQESEDKISFAGKNAVLIDIQYKPDKSPYAQHVGLTLATEIEAAGSHAATAARILTRDLDPGEQTIFLHAKLDKFADNLERLARMDKLSTQGANCFDAVYGVYSSLKKLFDFETKAAEILLESAKSQGPSSSPSIDVMCTKSGRPRMNAGDRVGLSLEYWKDQRLVRKEGRKSLKRKADAMDADESKKESGDDAEGDGTIHSLTIECEYSSPALYPPFRISESWISDRIMKPAHDSSKLEEGQGADEKPPQSSPSLTETIEWLDPASPLAIPDPTSDSTAPKPPIPHARFVAHLHPPIVLPFPTASHVYACVELNIGQDGLTPAAFENLVLPHSHRQSSSADNESAFRPISATRKVASSPTQDSEYQLRLFLPRVEVSVQITRLAFSHPRQLIAILPTLRQYAFIARLLRNSFAASPPASAPNSAINTNGTKPNGIHESGLSTRGSQPTAPIDPNGQEAEDDLDAFLALPTKASNIVDATFVATPSPHINLTFPTLAGLKHVRFMLGLNGAVEVVDEDILPVSDTSVADSARQDDAYGDGDAPMSVEEAKDPEAEPKTTQEDDPAKEADMAEETKPADGDDEKPTASSAEKPDADTTVADPAVDSSFAPPTIDPDHLARRAKLARALAVCEDLGTWVAWVKRAVLKEEDDAMDEAPGA